MDEIVYNEGLPTGTGPDAIAVPLRQSDAPGTTEIEAWISNFGGSNVHILSGALSLAQCQGQMERGFLDFIMTITGTGPVCRQLPSNVGTITLFFEGANNSGQTQVVTVKLTKHRHRR